VSLLGVDVGSTAVKAAAYSNGARELARAQQAIPSRHDRPGSWQVDADEVWQATGRVVRQVATSPQVRRDPPQAIAFSASGRESFPARADGSALGPCLRTGDARRPRIQATDLMPRSPQEWVQACGHVPDHMDPGNRLLWWQETSPDTLANARWFLGWHELASLKLAGRPVADPALAAGFFMFDIEKRAWSQERIDTLGIDPQILPEIVPWATPIGTLRPGPATELGLPPDCVFVAGSWDGSCAAVGSGATDTGIAMLTAGTWESVVVPASEPDLAEAASARLAVTPHPSTPGTGVWARSPNGTSVLDWALGLTGIPLQQLEADLMASGSQPSDVLVVPHLSGAGPPWPLLGRPGGAVLGVTLATTPLDLVRATLEGIACDLRYSIAAIQQAGAAVDRCRAAGGGSRSGWWMQLKADLLGVPVEVAAHDEPGTLGAALLAGIGIRIYRSLAEATAHIPVARRFDPDPGRAAAFSEKLEAHGEAVRWLTSARRVRTDLAGKDRHATHR
jgi:xylulokinase